MRSSINTMLKDALMSRSDKRLYEVGKIFYKLGRVDEFKDGISRMRPDADRIFRNIYCRLNDSRYTWDPDTRIL